MNRRKLLAAVGATVAAMALPVEGQTFKRRYLVDATKAIPRKPVEVRFYLKHMVEEHNFIGHRKGDLRTVECCSIRHNDGSTLGMVVGPLSNEPTIYAQTLHNNMEKALLAYREVYGESRQFIHWEVLEHDPA